MASIDDLIRALLAAVDSDKEITITIRNSSTVKPGHEVNCPRCEWQGTYTRKANALRALRRHSKRCTRKDRRGEDAFKQWVNDMHYGENDTNKKHS